MYVFIVHQNTVVNIIYKTYFYELSIKVKHNKITIIAILQLIYNNLKIIT